MKNMDPELNLLLKSDTRTESLLNVMLKEEKQP